MRDSQRVNAERLLVNRCLEGDQGAWRSLCVNQRPRLLHNLRRLLGRGSFPRQIDDIISEVWSSLLVNNYDRLRRYDPSRTALSTYLTALALQQVWRAERRKHRRAAEIACTMRGQEPVLARSSDRPTELLIEEMCSILPKAQAEFVRQLVWPERNIGPVRSSAAARQRKHRIRVRVVSLAARL